MNLVGPTGDLADGSHRCVQHHHVARPDARELKVSSQ
jgi:hypothetical protein